MALAVPASQGTTVICPPGSAPLFPENGPLTPLRSLPGQNGPEASKPVDFPGFAQRIFFNSGSLCRICFYSGTRVCIGWRVMPPVACCSVRPRLPGGHGLEVPSPLA